MHLTHEHQTFCQITCSKTKKRDNLNDRLTRLMRLNSNNYSTGGKLGASTGTGAVSAAVSAFS